MTELKQLLPELPLAYDSIELAASLIRKKLIASPDADDALNLLEQTALAAHDRGVAYDALFNDYAEARQLLEAENLTLRNAAVTYADQVDALTKALDRLLVEAGEGSSRGRALDLLPKKTIALAREALVRAHANEPRP